MSASDSKIIETAPLSEKDAVWIRLVKLTYLDPNGVRRTWESAERTTRPKGGDIDGVGIVAILKKETGESAVSLESGTNLLNVGDDEGPEVILQKQYRPPVGRVTVEIPAGLIDAGETAEQCAERELKEETGYVGTAKACSPIMFNDPGFCNTNLRMVHVEVDMSLPENQKPVPELEENEFIEVFTVPLTRLWDECYRLEREGYAIDARIGTMAEGIELAKKFKL